MNAAWPGLARWGVAFGLSLLALLATGGAAFAMTSQPPWLTAAGGAALWAFASFWTFVAGWAALKLALSFGGPCLAVARTVLDEALRMKVAVVFGVLLLLILSILPFATDPAAPLRYRIQTFLSFSLEAVGTLLSVMTVFLACGTLSGEIQDQRIFNVAVKPVGRGAYLLGKWLGLALLDGLLLCVAGVAIAGAARLLELQPAQDAHDRRAVSGEVLTARVAVRPKPLESFAGEVARRLAELKQTQPGKLEELGEEAARKQVWEQALLQWRTIPPFGRETFVFAGLQEAARAGGVLQLRYMLYLSATGSERSRRPPRDEVRLRLHINQRSRPLVATSGVFQLISIPAELVSPEGRLELVVENADPTDPARTFPVSLVFPPKDGLEVLYSAGAFEANFARTLAILWIKLAFLAMLGVAAATCLGFPVACLLTLVVLFIAALSGFLIEAVEMYGENADSQALRAGTLAFRWLVKALAELFSQYGRFSPIELLVDGRLVPWSDVAACAGWIGAAWTGVAALTGWAIFRARELGRVQA